MPVRPGDPPSRFSARPAHACVQTGIGAGEPGWAIVGVGKSRMGQLGAAGSAGCTPDCVCIDWRAAAPWWGTGLMAISVLYSTDPLQPASKAMRMIRFCLCLLIVLGSAGVAAREVKLSSPSEGSCPDSVVDRQVVSPTARRSPPARETRAKPTVPSDVQGNGRLHLPRWHSFLPGMFR